ncbi:PfkB family carbohydrate kinase [Paenibacillus qinlingensis]|uniref:RfaE bifunctional protein kinase chain/domain n=1 Tax=Paenibacillus qinlingensis TaxID=1837343 RepID=A0ABU1NXN7_9BACL|nr:PfkB family carbohydrate kinase [Paenibacillus qinlingensis]MDR6552235.1 rfaE bifunctional protein kinase chain/domain [Paenibacillus qinlingensis]
MELHYLGIERYTGLTSSGAERILEHIPRLKAGVIGDGCLDIYWHADMTKSELSRETPHYPLPIVKEIFSPGAAGNVAANVKALGCSEVYFCSVFGNDWRGSLLRDTFQRLGIDDRYSLYVDEWLTPAYCKPIRHGMQGASQEDPRLDFNNHRPLSDVLVSQLVVRLDQMAEVVDIIAVTDQLHFGVVGEAVRERLAYWAEQGKIIVLDSRDRIGAFKGIIAKPNEIEALRWAEPSLDPYDGSWSHWLSAARKLSEHTGAPCCLTLGDKGSLWVEKGRAYWTNARKTEPPLDIVGAGDCFASALLCALGVGSNGMEAMAFAHAAAAVVVRKIGMTGTATPLEILESVRLDPA